MKLKFAVLVAVLTLAIGAFAQSGTVTIYDGANAICQAPLTNGAFSCANPQLASLAVGTHSLTAVFPTTTSGGIQYQTSTSPVFSQVVQSNQQSTNTTLNCTANPSVQGVQVTCSGTVAPQ